MASAYQIQEAVYSTIVSNAEVIISNMPHRLHPTRSQGLSESTGGNSWGEKMQGIEEDVHLILGMLRVRM